MCLRDFTEQQGVRDAEPEPAAVQDFRVRFVAFGLSVAA